MLRNIPNLAFCDKTINSKILPLHTNIPNLTGLPTILHKKEEEKGKIASEMPVPHSLGKCF